MELTVGMFLLIFALAFLYEMIDSSIGMGYGTLLTPTLLIMGFEPLICVPAVLLSQAFGGLIASLFHHRFENVSFHPASQDFKIASVITLFGMFATILAALIAIKIPKTALNTYIGLLVLTMGVIILRNQSFSFSWKKMMGIGILSAFNKGLSGGGFGPVVTAGQILAGQEHKRAIGVTTLAEAPICIMSFLTYVFAKMAAESSESIFSMPVTQFTATLFSNTILNWPLTIALILGSVMVAPFGPLVTRILKKEYLHYILGIAIIVLGGWTLYKTWF